MSPRSPIWWPAVAGLAFLLVIGLGCKKPPRDLSGFPCQGDQGCLSGWVCHPQLQICVPEITVACDGSALCPSTINSGDPCDSDGSFVPCQDGEFSCKAGCRTCDLATGWSPCVCDTGTIENCSACGDDCLALPNVSEATCDGSSASPVCLMTNCDGGWSDADGLMENGCEAPCTTIGLETCNGDDDDCDGTIDDMTPEAVFAECDAAAPDVGVQEWQCTGACAVSLCLADLHDINGVPADGCEYACAVIGAESCNAVDDDCNGLVDDLAPADLTADCATQFPAAVGVNTWLCPGACTIGSCSAARHDINGLVVDGCEYSCTATGSETCNGIDDNCSGGRDDLAPAEVDADCSLQYPVAQHVTSWVCTGACAIGACEANWTNATGGLADGCETACTPTVPATEVCDDVDNDCDGTTDNPGAPGCTIHYLDLDGDGFGQLSDTLCLCAPSGYYSTTTSGDCDDNNSNCTTDCTDLDGDGYCVTSDCDDTGVTGGSCFVGCSTYFADDDSDTFGDGTRSSISCVAPAGYVGNSDDCDDTRPNCTLDCADADGDGYCMGVDCDATDSNPNCYSDCTDVDGDGYCVNTDCNDDDPGCTWDCSLCAPGMLLLTTTTPLPLCGVAILSLDFGGSLIVAAADITCSARRQTLDGVTGFETGVGSWTGGSDTRTKNWPAGFPASCGSVGSYLEFSRTGGTLMLGSPIDATGYVELEVSLVAGYKGAPPAGENLQLLGCCGPSCSPSQFATVLNQSSGGTDACSSYSLQAPSYADACASLTLHLQWTSSGNYVGIDDLAVTGIAALQPMSNSGGGFFTTSLTSCTPADVVVDCTWDDGTNPSRSDTITVRFQ